MQSEGPGKMDEKKHEPPFAYMVMFHANQYLSDTHFQKLLIEASRKWPQKGEAHERLVQQYQPLPLEELKQARDLDVYVFQSIGGHLNRVHFVKKDGNAYVNPAPEDYRCESCHKKGWLRENFQESRIDGATIPVWLCLECEKLEPQERGIKF